MIMVPREALLTLEKEIDTYIYYNPAKELGNISS
jgi:hypothetical protein